MKKQNLKPDAVLKTFWQNNEHFADLFNAVLFNGQPILDPDTLLDSDTDLSTIVPDKEYLHTMQRTFDVVKKTIHGVDYVLFVLENQQNIHYAMPVRQMLNEALAYYKEYSEIALRNEAENSLTSGAEFLSRFKKTDRLHPIVSLCVYYGEAEWDGPVTLKEMLDLPDYLQDLVADYKMHLVQIHKNGNLNFHNEDVKTVFKICSLLYDHKISQFKAIFESQTVRPDLGIVIGSIVGSKKITTAAKEAAKSKEDLPMWSALQEWETECEMRGEARGEARGKARGERIGLFKGIISTYKELNISEKSAIEKLTGKHGLSHDEAAMYVKQYWK